MRRFGVSRTTRTREMRAWPLVLAACIGSAAGPGGASGTPPAPPQSYGQGRETFITEMVERHGLARPPLESLLAGARYRQDIIDAMERPYEAQPWHRYRRIFLTPKRTSSGITYWHAHRQELARAEATYGVPPEMIVAIIGIETLYGANTGKHQVLDALTTLGFSYAKRAAFFRGELEAFLLLARDQDLDPARAKGSYAGAMGRPQFIPSSYRSYSVDFDGDGRRDLWGSDADVIGSVANYFNRHGWRPGEAVAFPATVEAGLPGGLEIAEKLPLAPNTTAGALRVAGVDWRGPVASDQPATLIRLDASEDQDEYWIGLDNFYVITRYNHSNLYAMAAHQLAQAIRAGYAAGAK